MNQLIISQIENGYVVISPAIPKNEQHEAEIAAFYKATGQRPTIQHFVKDVDEACEYIRTISA